MEIKVRHDSRDIRYRKPFGALKVGEKVRLRLEVLSSRKVDECFLRLSYNREIKEKFILMKRKKPVDNLQVFEVSFLPEEEVGICWYYFKLSFGDDIFYYGNNDDLLGGEGILGETVPKGYQITLYNEVKVPDWFKDGIMYQIYVDRFFKKEMLPTKKNSLIHGDWYDTPFYIREKNGRIFRWDFFGGNLKGVIDKLGYLKDLGITIIYFNPIFESVSNHKYDTGDYFKIDEMYGDLDVFKELVSKCKNLGIEIILDGVFNHTGSNSIYFNKYGDYPSIGAYMNKDSSYYSWYKFIGDGKKYKSWWGIDDLPEVDKENEEFRNFIYKGEDSVVKKWMKLGIKGWRLDVADELSDDFIKGIKSSLKEEDTDGVLIGEVWEDASNKVSYGNLRKYFNGDELDSVMNYPFRKALLDFMLFKTTGSNVANKLMSLYENYPRENFFSSMNILGSHDMERVLTLLGEGDLNTFSSEEEKASFLLSDVSKALGIKRLKLLSLIQFTFPGVPCIYYGDEAGVEGFRDPYNRKTYPWGKENLEVLAWYKRMTTLRSNFELSKLPYFKAYNIGEDIFCYELYGDDKRLVAYINRNITHSYDIEVEGDEGKELLDVLSGNYLSSNRVNLKPLEGRIIWEKSVSRIKRSSGLLLPIFSLPGDFGIGDLGVSAFKFVDFLKESGSKYWQVLPNNPIGSGNSPYYSPSVMAGNPLYISLDKLKDLGLLGTWELLEEKMLLKEEHNSRSYDDNYIDYDLVEKHKDILLRRAYSNFRSLISKKYKEGFLSHYSFYSFVANNDYWLKDYALFSYYSSKFGDDWHSWKTDNVDVDREEIEYYYFLQYTYSIQWSELKKYANSFGIKIIGDVPIYVAPNSTDTWSNKDIFDFSLVAGVPGDSFSEEGQVWGNPTYRWNEDCYSWWKKRIKASLRDFDLVRLDHFRGFEAYYGIDKDGRVSWYKGPGLDFFKSLGVDPKYILAEDLGHITPEVNNLKNILDMYGMEVYPFIDEDVNLNKKVFYSSNHDTNTLVGFLIDRGFSREKALVESERIIDEILNSSSDLTIFPVQDILGLDGNSRVNVPGTVSGNWQWKLKEEDLDFKIASLFREKTIRSSRS